MNKLQNTGLKISRHRVRTLLGHHAAMRSVDQNNLRSRGDPAPNVSYMMRTEQRLHFCLIDHHISFVSISKAVIGKRIVVRDDKPLVIRLKSGDVDMLIDSVLAGL